MQSVMPFITTWSGMAKQSARGCRLTRSVILGDTFVEISLRTKDYHEALKKVAELVPITQARTAEVVAAHVNEARGFAKLVTDLALTDAWSKYEQHPDRAMPHTVSEQLAYRTSFMEFVDFAIRARTKEERQKLIQHTQITLLREVTPAVVAEYAAYLRRQPLSI